MGEALPSGAALALRLRDPRLAQPVAGADALAAHSLPECATTYAAPLASAPADGPGAGRRPRGRRAPRAHGALPTNGAGLRCQEAVQRAVSEPCEVFMHGACMLPVHRLRDRDAGLWAAWGLTGAHVPPNAPLLSDHLLWP